MKLVLFLAAAPAFLLQAQPARSAATRRFEVVSIRRHAVRSATAETARAQTGPTPDGFRAIGLPMFALFQMAYALPNQKGLLRGSQIEGDPGWLTSELYDVLARVDETDLPDWQNPQMRQTMLRTMLQGMLAERCKAAVHYDNKEAPVFDLVISKGGPKFKRAETVDSVELRRKHPTGGMMRGAGVMTVHGPETTHFYGISMATLADTILSSIADRPVVDKTGLSGYYDIALPTPALQPASASIRPQAPSILPQAGAVRPQAPIILPQAPDTQPGRAEAESIFTALPEVLGLRLQAANGRVQTLVIDHVERPSGN